MSFCWSTLDSNLLVSSGKDNMILGWNPNKETAEIVYELTTNGQWCFDVAFCRRNPQLIGAASYEGHVGVYSLMGGQQNILQATSSQIMDSFGESAEETAAHTKPIEVAQQHIEQLKIAPKWMRPQCGASFGVSNI